MNDATVDPERMKLHGATGIYILAKDGDMWVSVDIACLTRASLTDWLGLKPQLAMRTVLVLLGHDPNNPMSPELDLLASGSLLHARLREVRELLDGMLDVKEFRLPASLRLATQARSKLRTILGEPDPEDTPLSR